MEIISNLTHYIIEFIVSVVLGLFFADKIEKVVGIIAIMIISSVGLSMVYDEEINPLKYSLLNSTGVSNLTKNISDYTMLGVNVIMALVVGGSGTAVGVGFRKIFRF